MLVEKTEYRGSSLFHLLQPPVMKISGENHQAQAPNTVTHPRSQGKSRNGSREMWRKAVKKSTSDLGYRWLGCFNGRRSLLFVVGTYAVSHKGVAHR